MSKLTREGRSTRAHTTPESTETSPDCTPCVMTGRSEARLSDGLNTPSVDMVAADVTMKRRRVIVPKRAMSRASCLELEARKWRRQLTEGRRECDSSVTIHSSRPSRTRCRASPPWAKKMGVAAPVESVDAAALRPRVLAAVEEAVLVVVGGGLAVRLDDRDLRECGLHGGALRDGAEPARQVGVVVPLDALRVVIARPREGRDVGDGVLVTAEKLGLAEPLLQHLVEPLQLRGVACLPVLAAGRREHLEMSPLAEHRADARHLDHQPLDDLVFFRGILRQELPGLLGKVEQDRARLEHRVWLSARALVIDDGGNLVVRIDLQELGLVLLARPDVDEVLLVGQPGLFEHDVDLLHVRAGQCVEIDHGSLTSLRKPLLVQSTIRTGKAPQDDLSAGCAIVGCLPIA